MAKLATNTYGDALFDLAVEEAKIDALYEEANAVLTAFEENNELGKLLNHPKIDKEEKQKFIEDVFGKFVSKDMTGLLILMVSKDRQQFITDTLAYFTDRVLEFKRIGKAVVTTAKPLSESQKAKVVARLLATTNYVSFNMEYAIDESLIGGMVIRIGDRVVDSSIKTKLEGLAKDLTKIQLA
ncbi:MAG: ATP synthase F1 subunit delta [Lachnospira sp.]|nr:ATP synthase F1 subunit delta [Lachnospira sp.]